MHNYKTVITRVRSEWFQKMRSVGVALFALLACALAPAQTSVTISSPAPSAVMSQGSVDVSGSFGGTNLTVISVFNGLNSTVVAKKTGATSYVAQSVPLAPGSNSLTVTALQRDGTSATATVNVTYPVLGVVLTSPSKYASYTVPPTSLTLQASALAVPGFVQRVEYHQLSGGLIGTATTPPYTYVWNAPPSQSFTFFARMFDDAGRSSDSSGINVNITAPNQPPVVSLTAPVSGASYTAPANFSLQASASDPDGTVSLVEFLGNGGLLGATNTPPYTFALTGQPAGSYVFTARATDDKGAKTTSAAVAVTVSQITPPTVSLTSPAAGSSYQAPANIQMSANASATGGSITKVDFTATRSGAPPVTASASNPPYTTTLSVAEVGTYTLAAIAYDSNGISATSDPITVSVSDGVTYLHSDFAGNPIAATDSAGAVVWKENYKPYGGRNDNPPAGVGNRLAFHGKPLDQETGLSYFGARYYDPLLGRFMGADPIRFSEENLQSFNRYAYGNNNPYKYVDPDGKAATLILRAGAMAVVLAGAAMTPGQREQMQQAGSRAVQRTRDALARLGNWVFNEGNEGADGEKPSLLDPRGDTHILDGDGPNAGGGHRHGTGKSGKSEFPANWSDDKIRGEVSDVATDPSSTSTTQPNGRIKLQGTRDGVDITVIVEPHSRGGRIVTGFPTNTPRNP